MQTLAEMRAMLDACGLRPKKRFGQNFLVDQNLLVKLVDAAGVAAGDTVLEVGPGTGTLTEALLERGASVIACELDRDLCALMRDRFSGAASFRLVEGDCMAGKRAVSPDLLEAVGDGAFKLVANLPYAAATPLLLSLMLDHPLCSSCAVTVQREVADRFLGEPGTKAYGPLSIASSLTGVGRRVAELPPACFWPRPEVESAMVLWTRGAACADARGACDLAQRLFTQRRKHVRAAVKSLKLDGLHPDALPVGIEPQTRVEALEPEAFVRLSAAAGAR